MNGRTKTFHTMDNSSEDFTFDNAGPSHRDNAKFDFASIKLDLDTKVNQDDDSGESIRSTQISHSSAKPFA